MTEIKWEEPPTPKSIDWKAIEKALKGNPGAWALVAESYGNNRPNSLRHADGFEVTARIVPDTAPRKYDVYARYKA